MKSLRLHLIIGILSTISLITFLSILKGYKAGVSEAEVLFDSQLRAIARLVVDLEPFIKSNALSEPVNVVYQVWTSEGHLVRQSSGAPAYPIAEFNAGFSERNFNGSRWRVLTFAQPEHWIFVAEPIDLRFELADKMVMQYVLPFLISLPVAGLLIWLIISSGFSLLTALCRELSQKRPDDLSTLTFQNPPSELKPVVDAINGLLIRLDDALERERRFSADAAHELRTPLSALKVHFHNLQKFLGEQEVHHARLLERDIQRLQHLVEQILMLHKMSPEQIRTRMRIVDLYNLARDVIGELYGEFERKHQSIALEGEHVLISGDAESLKILIANLLTNANKYGHAQGDVVVCVEERQQGVVLSVTDTGPGIAPEERARVFDRFYRVKGNRHNENAEGSGLGLAIVLQIAELHQAKVSLDAAPDHKGLIVTVVFAALPDRELLTEDLDHDL